MALHSPSCAADLRRRLRPSLLGAEQRVPSGIAAVVMATIPAFMALSEIAFLHTQRLNPSARCGPTHRHRRRRRTDEPLSQPGLARQSSQQVLQHFFSESICWSVASILTRKLPLPSSKVMSSGAQMLAGGLLLAVASASLGEFHRFHPTGVSRAAWLSLLYLIVFGSIIGFTALSLASPSRIANQGRHLCLREPCSGGPCRLFLRQRSSRLPHRGWNPFCSRQRHRHHHYETADSRSKSLSVS